MLVFLYLAENKYFLCLMSIDKGAHCSMLVSLVIILTLFFKSALHKKSRPFALRNLSFFPGLKEISPKLIFLKSATYIQRCIRAVIFCLKYLHKTHFVHLEKTRAYLKNVRQKMQLCNLFYIFSKHTYFLGRHLHLRIFRISFYRQICKQKRYFFYLILTLCPSPPPHPPSLR